MDALVSAIIPVYNVEKYINEAVDSILNQTYKNLEIILVDDGSIDDCGKICKEYASHDARIKVMHKINGGVSSARNIGIEVACGEWIYFMDPDDWIEPDAIEKALGFAVKNNCDMCMFDYELFYKNKKINHNTLMYPGHVFTDIVKNDLFLAYACAMGSICNIITKASIIKQLKFDEHVSVREDELFKFQLYGKMKSFCHIRETLYHYRCRAGSAVNTSDFFEKNRNNVVIYENEIRFVHSKGYPPNAVEAVHSKYLEGFWSVCRSIFEEDISAKEKKLLYKKYINSKEFKESIQDYSDLYFSNVLKIYLICMQRWKAPHWLLVRMLVAVKEVRNFFGEKF